MEFKKKCLSKTIISDNKQESTTISKNPIPTPNQKLPKIHSKTSNALRKLVKMAGSLMSSVSTLAKCHISKMFFFPKINCEQRTAWKCCCFFFFKISWFERCIVALFDIHQQYLSSVTFSSASQPTQTCDYISRRRNTDFWDPNDVVFLSSKKSVVVQLGKNSTSVISF